MRQEELKKVEKNIKTAWGAALFSMVITIILTVMSMLNENVAQKLGLSTYNFFDAFILGFLALGVYRKKRFASVALFVYFLLSVFINIVDGQLSGGIGRIIFGILYFKGMIACFKYYKHQVEIGEIDPDQPKGLKTYLGYGVLGFFKFCINYSNRDRFLYY
ncbi:hypothetical protein [Sediminitomix flava]|uniref:Uncharacterized protein n=1 Tax=Sediminitomix flava TaxID=379075 RepID=A0A316A0K1_SEDFL|nr:hypothetical protein [Sediminitomix flava]PWJ43167.1 hypothetical protein BC781_102716 [Sediminitomix flava]